MSTYVNTTIHFRSQSILRLAIHAQFQFSERKYSYMANTLNSLPIQKSCSQYLKAPSSPTSCFSQQPLLVCTMRVSSSRVYLTGSTPAGLQACLNYTASHAAKKPKPVLEPVKPPSATSFSEYEQVPVVESYTDSSWSTHFCVAQAHKGALCSHRMVCKICSECCPPSHCKSRYKNRFSSSAGFPLPIFNLMQSLTFNHHCCYCSMCILLIHTLVSPHTEAIFAVKSTALSFHLWIQTLLEATKGACMERMFLKYTKSKEDIIPMFSFR